MRKLKKIKRLKSKLFLSMHTMFTNRDSKANAQTRSDRKVGTARCAVRAAFSGATVHIKTLEDSDSVHRTRTATPQRGVSTENKKRPATGRPFTQLWCYTLTQ
jgi:hypothetical protein